MFKKILVPTDGSEIGLKAAATAAELAQGSGGQVVGVYVIDPFPYIGIGDASAVGLQGYLSDAKRVAGAALEGLAQACRACQVPFAGDTIERNLVWEGILTKACENGDLTRAGIHKARTQLDSLDTKELTGKLDLTDPGAPSSREDFVIKVSSSDIGGTKLVSELYAADEAKSYKAPYQK